MNEKQRKCTEKSRSRSAAGQWMSSSYSYACLMFGMRCESQLIQSFDLMRAVITVFVSSSRGDVSLSNSVIIPRTLRLTAQYPVHRVDESRCFILMDFLVTVLSCLDTSCRVNHSQTPLISLVSVMSSSKWTPDAMILSRSHRLVPHVDCLPNENTVTN